MPQIGFVRSGHVTPWDIPLMREMKALGYDISFISPFKENLPIPHKRAIGWRSFSPVDRIVRSGYVWYLNRLFKFNAYDVFSKFLFPKKAFKEFEYLIFNDDVFSLPYHSIKSKIKYGVVSWENIPFHYYFEYNRRLSQERQTVLKNAKHLFPVSNNEVSIPGWILCILSGSTFSSIKHISASLETGKRCFAFFKTVWRS